MACKTSMVMKDEGLIFSFLKCLRLSEIKRLWNLNPLFHKVLDGKVVPLLALYERDWGIVSHYMDFPSEGRPEGHPRFEYNFDTIAIEATLHEDFQGLQLLAGRKYDFDALARDARLTNFARDALRSGSIKQLFVLNSIGFGYDDILNDCTANEELSQHLQVNLAISVDFFGTRLVYHSSALDFATNDFVQVQLSHLCSRRERLFRVPFVMAAFMRAGASPCSFLQPNGCGYLLLLAFASESFNFVYLLVKESVYLDEVFDRYRNELQSMITRALENGRLVVLSLMAFAGFKLREGDEGEQSQFDHSMLENLQKEEFRPIECLIQLGYSFFCFAERNPSEFHSFVQSRLAQGAAAAKPGCPTRPPTGVHPTIRSLMKLDRRALELHFRSRVFVDFAGDLLARKSFVRLQQIVEVHPHAMQPYFAENFAFLETLLMNAFHTKDTVLIVDMSLLVFPMGRFFVRNQVELDAVVRGWLQSKCWTELTMLKSEVLQSKFPAMFERNRDWSDAFVLKMISDGYWFDLHNLRSLSFDFSAFFHRCFAEVSEVVLSFTAVSHPHFVLLRELSALNFPWARFMNAHPDKISSVKDHDFLQFVMSLDGFELGSKVYDIVEQTCCLYHAMNASMFDVEVQGSVLSPEEEYPVEIVASSVHASAEAATSSPRPSRQRLEPLPVPLQSAASSSSSSSRICPLQLRRTRQLRLTQGASVPTHAGGACPETTAASGFQQQLVSLVRKSHDKQLDTKKMVKLLICKGAYCWNPLNINLDDVSNAPSTAQADVVGGRPPIPDAIGSRPAFSNELRERAWLHVEGVHNFLDAVDDGWLPFYSNAGLAAAAVAAAGLPPQGAPAGVAPAVAGPVLPIGAAPPAMGPFLPVGAHPGNAAGFWPWAMNPGGGALPAAGFMAGAQVAAAAALAAAAAAAANGGHIGLAPAPFQIPPLLQIAPHQPAAANGQPLVAFHLSCLAQPGELFFFRSNLDLFWDGLLERVLPLEQ